MKWSLKKPCSGCPFLRDGGVRLDERRVIEIAGGMLHHDNIVFSCHKTTIFADDDDGETVTHHPPQHCAGAMIFALKHGAPTQMMRISARLGLLDLDGLMADSSIVSSVFTDFAEMLEVNRQFFAGTGRSR